MNSNSTDLSTSELRSFGFILAVVLYLIGSWWTWSWDHPLTYISSVIIIIAVTFPKGLVWVHGPWMFIGGKIATINITIFLSLVYFLLFTPLSFFFKCTGRDLLQLKSHHNDKESFWEPYDSHESTIERYRRLF